MPPPPEALEVVALCDPLEQARQQHDRKRRVPADVARHRLLPRDVLALHREALAEHPAHRLEELLVLDLLLGEPQQRPHGEAIAVNVRLGPLGDRRDDVLLDEQEQVGVAGAPRLIESQPLVGRQERDVVDPSDPIGQEPLREVELQAGGHIGEVPVHSLGRPQALVIVERQVHRVCEPPGESRGMVQQRE